MQHLRIPKCCKEGLQKISKFNLIPWWAMSSSPSQHSEWLRTQPIITTRTAPCCCCPLGPRMDRLEEVDSNDDWSAAKQCFDWDVGLCLESILRPRSWRDRTKTDEFVSFDLVRWIGGIERDFCCVTDDVYLSLCLVS